ncbi:hypothetical protein, partial [Prescottella equi]
NTHTPSLETHSFSFRGNRSSLTRTRRRRKSATGRSIGNRQALPVQPRFPSLTNEGRGRVGVRVALTWNKLREPFGDCQIA